MNIERYQTVGIASEESKLKLGAILFDKVYNVDKTIEIPSQLLTRNPIDNTAFDRIKNKLKDELNTGYLQQLSEKLIPKYFIDKNTVNRDELEEILKATYRESMAKTYNHFALEVANQISKHKTIGVPIFNETILYDHLENDYINNYSQEKIEVKIINAPIISASELEWSQIIEARKDEDFIKKVKRFSLFINKDYKGRDLPFIIDDLSMQVEDYKTACNKHGVKLKDETIKSLTNSKTLFGTFGLSLCALMTELPEYAIVTSVIGMGLEILNLHVTIRQYEDKFESFVKDCPISLIFEIDKMKSLDSASLAKRNLC